MMRHLRCVACGRKLKMNDVVSLNRYIKTSAGFLCCECSIAYNMGRKDGINEEKRSDSLRPETIRDSYLRVLDKLSVMETMLKSKRD